MKLSEAIRAAGPHVRHIRHAYLKVDSDEPESAPCACALGMAYLGMRHFTTPTAITEEIQRRMHPGPLITLTLGLHNLPPSPWRVHPILHEPRHIADIVIDLNDDRQWTWQQIADWLESEGL